MKSNKSELNTGWKLENTYTSLPAPLFTRQRPEPVKSPTSVKVNYSLASELGMNPDELLSPGGTAILAGNILPPGSDPIAQAYAGHQFGHFTMLGDGRAILLGEQVTPKGQRIDVQLKGSGRTPYSRQGDGRAALGPMLREYLISEAMHALGVPTTRSLAVVITGEPVLRETVLDGAILTRTAASHIRVGTFEFAARCGEKTLQPLVTYTINRHFPECAEAANPALELLKATTARQAGLLAQWMHIGFVHGVMNTDNMAISGETIDYGPCAFIDAYDPKTVFSSIDHNGRYAYARQPEIAQWNLARFAETMLTLIDKRSQAAIDQAEAVLNKFAEQYQSAWLAAARKRLGLTGSEADDKAIIMDLFAWMREAAADYTNTFAALCADQIPASAPFNEPPFQKWHERWIARLIRQPGGPQKAQEMMRPVVPAVIPRNHKVEEALDAAVNNHDIKPLERLLTIINNPFNHGGLEEEYCTPPPPGTPPYRTFCGT